MLSTVPVTVLGLHAEIVPDVMDPIVAPTVLFIRELIVAFNLTVHMIFNPDALSVTGPVAAVVVGEAPMATEACAVEPIDMSAATASSAVSVALRKRVTLPPTL